MDGKNNVLEKRKKCCCCKMLCPLSEFGKHYKLNANSICRPCKSKQNRDYYERIKKMKEKKKD